MLRFAVLGRVEVRDGERVVDLGPARRTSVLAALLVDAGHVVPVDVLAERVWDGRPPASAVSTLQAHVSRLRGVLGGAGTLRTTPAGYLLDVAGEAVDAARFEALAARAHDLAANGDADAARAEVAAALGLWSGRAYADVIADFATAEAARLDELRLTAYELAAELDVAAGRAAEAADRLGPVVAEHPFRERLRAALVTALAATGRRAEALACLRDGRRLLVDELGVEPGERLRALQEEILTEGDDTPAAPIPVPELAPAAGPPDERLVGRADELDTIVEVCRGAGAATTGFVALRGEAGIGKTRLAEEASAWAAAHGYAVAWGRCWRHEGSPALWPWIEVVRELDRVTAPDVLAEALAGRGAPLTTVVPELAGDVERPAGGDVVEVRVFDAVLHVLGRLGTVRPLLVVIDDAQWADPWSRRLLEYLAGHARDLHLTVMVTLRAGVDDAVGLAVLAGLSRSGRLAAVEIEGLDADGVGELVAARTGRILDDATRAALRERTEGNPFYVGEITRLVGDGDPAAAALPGSVRGVVGQRLASLSGTDGDVLAVAAVVGRTFDLDLVAAVSGLDENLLDDVVDRAVRAGVLRDEPTDEGDLRFTHALLQETLLDEIGPSRRRRLHRRIAAVLAEQRRVPSGRIPAADRIARHHLAIGGDADLRAAVDLLLEAADDALRRRSIPEVQRLLGDAATAADRVGHGAEALVGSIRARRITFEVVVNRPQEMDPGNELQEPDLTVGGADLLAAAYARWTWPMTHGRVHTAKRFSDELMAIARERDDDLLRFGALVMRLTDRFVAGQFRAVLDACDEADELVDRVTVPSLVFLPHPALSIPFWRGLSLLLLGDAEGARRTHSATRQRVTALRDAVNDAYLDAFDVYWWTFFADPVSTAAAVLTARRTMERTGVTSLDYFLAMPEAWAASHRDLPRALELAQAADLLVSGPDSLTFRPLFRALHADLLMRSGDHAAAAHAVALGLEESAAYGQAFGDAELHRLRAKTLAGLGAPDADVAAARARARSVGEEQGAVLFLDRLAADEAAG